MPGTLYVVATPIGNLEDVTLRALRILREVSVIAAEDTRRTSRLLQHYSISTPTTSLHEHNESAKTPGLIQRLLAGESGAGTITSFDASELATTYACEVPRDPEVADAFHPDDWLAPKDQRKVDTFILFAIAAADQALADTGWKPEDEADRERTGVIVGSGIGGLSTIADTAIVLSQAAESGGKMEVVGQFSTGESYGGIYPKGSANAAVLDQVIQSMLDDGTVKKLAGKYLAEAWGADPTAVPYFQP